MLITSPAPITQQSKPASCDHRNKSSLYEVTRGGRSILDRTSAYCNQIGNRLLFHLSCFLHQYPIGTALSESLFVIPTSGDPDNQRRPSVAFLSASRWPLCKNAPDETAWPVAPNLVLEIAGPDDRIVELHTKIKEYFEAGVELVWVVDPHQENASVYTSPTQVTIITREGNLEGGRVIPGFTLPMAKLFARSATH